ncbi:MAG: hypothetical protein C3F13_17860 [Anaerolineales bacterium]|nr:MAG: hypothetical protein C3F13_17860 [Anaerolineales bacterium]
MFAKAFQGKLHCIYYPRFQTPIYTPARYVLQALRTLQALFTERPRAVHVQNPPVICGLVVGIYCYITRTKFVFDHHSAAFDHVWEWALPIQKLLARRAVTNIVTTQHWADIVSSWGAHALIMGDPFLALPTVEAFSAGTGFRLAFISTFSPDEPLEAVVRAATELPQVHVYITGDAKNKPKSFHDSLPTNVTCTGFLSDAQYIGLLRAVDVIMALTTRNHTLQLGGVEAVSIGQPLITSDWPFLREFFPKGTVYVNNTSDGIRDGILLMMNERVRLKREIAVLRDEKRQQWTLQAAKLDELVAQAINAH